MQLFNHYIYQFIYTEASLAKNILVTFAAIIFIIISMLWVTLKWKQVTDFAEVSINPHNYTHFCSVSIYFLMIDPTVHMLRDCIG